MVAPIVPIGVLLGKADTAFKLVGGSSIVFNAIRSRIFGKILRSIEYPDGELHSVKIYRSSIYRLKTLIAETQPPPFPTAFLEPEDIKQISVFTSPHFTEAVVNDSDVSALPDNAWLLWSKDSVDDAPIPTRGVKLDGSHVIAKPAVREDPILAELRVQDAAISAATRALKAGLFSRWQYDRLIDMSIDRDPGLIAIARNFASSDNEFRRHSIRLLNRRDPRSILVGDGTSTQGKENDGIDGDAEDGPKRNLEPQVELSSRE